MLTLTPTYRVVARQSSGGGSGSDGDKKSGMTIEVDIPGVRKDAVALDAQGNRLKLVAAKYSPDGRSAWCTSSSSSKRRRNNNKKVDGGKKTSSDDAQQQKDDDGGGGGKILPSIVYKLHLRISSRADIEQARASYRGDGVLLIGIPYKTEEVKKISINIED